MKSETSESKILTRKKTSMDSLGKVKPSTIVSTTKNKPLSAECITEFPISYVNRTGGTYYVHQGQTKSGKPKYFASKQNKGALSKLPDGFVFGESINGVVTIQRPRPQLVPQADLDLAKDAIAQFKHLTHYRVEPKERAILIYEPMGLNSIDALSKIGSYSIFDDLKEKLGKRFESILEDTAKQMGVSVSDLKRADAVSSDERRRKGAEHLLRNIQYDAVMRFTFDQLLGSYVAERRCYRGEEHWALLATGPIEKLLKKYVHHIGRESFFELM